MLFLVVAVLTQVLNVVVVASATRAAWRITNGLRLDITRHVLGLDHEFHRRHTPGELIQRVDGDVTNVSEFLSQVVPKVAGAAILLAGMLVVLPCSTGASASACSSTSPAGAALVMSMRHRAVRESSDEMGAYAAAVRRHRGAADGGRGPALQRRRDPRDVAVRRGQLRRARERGAAGERRSCACGGRCRSMSPSASSGTLVLSAFLVSNGAITLGTAFLLFQYVHLMIRPLEDLVHQLETVQKANGAMRRVADLLAHPADGGRRWHDLAAAGPADRHLHRRRVRLPGRPADPPRRRRGGRRRALGRCRRAYRQRQDDVLPPAAAPGRDDHGQRRLGGVPIADIPLAELRRRVALVPQEVELFEGTIRDNVTLFDAAPTDADVEPRCATSGSMRSPTAASTARSAPPAPDCRPGRRSCWRSPACGCATPTSWSSTRRRRASIRRPSGASRRPSPS